MGRRISNRGPSRILFHVQKVLLTRNQDRPHLAPDDDCPAWNFVMAPPFTYGNRLGSSQGGRSPRDNPMTLVPPHVDIKVWEETRGIGLGRVPHVGASRTSEE